MENITPENKYENMRVSLDDIDQEFIRLYAIERAAIELIESVPNCNPIDFTELIELKESLNLH